MKYKLSEEQWAEVRRRIIERGETAAAIARGFNIPVKTFQQLCKSRGIKRLKYTGCDDDCENCRYPDCIKPSEEM